MTTTTMLRSLQHATLGLAKDHEMESSSGDGGGGAATEAGSILFFPYVVSILVCAGFVLLILRYFYYWVAENCFGREPPFDPVLGELVLAGLTEEERRAVVQTILSKLQVAAPEEAAVSKTEKNGDKSKKKAKESTPANVPCATVASAPTMVDTSMELDGQENCRGSPLTLPDANHSTGTGDEPVLEEVNDEEEGRVDEKNDDDEGRVEESHGEEGNFEGSHDEGHDEEDLDEEQGCTEGGNDEVNDCVEVSTLPFVEDSERAEINDEEQGRLQESADEVKACVEATTTMVAEEPRDPEKTEVTKGEIDLVEENKAEGCVEASMLTASETRETEEAEIDDKEKGHVEESTDQGNGDGASEEKGHVEESIEQGNSVEAFMLATEEPHEPKINDEDRETHEPDVNDEGKGIVEEEMKTEANDEEKGCVENCVEEEHDEAEGCVEAPMPAVENLEESHGTAVASAALTTIPHDSRLDEAESRDIETGDEGSLKPEAKNFAIGQDAALLKEYAMANSIHSSDTDEDDSNLCPICLGSLDHQGNNDKAVVASSHCRHVYHLGCISEWLDGRDKNDCPVCRVGMITNEDMMRAALVFVRKSYGSSNGWKWYMSRLQEWKKSTARLDGNANAASASSD